MRVVYIYRLCVRIQKPISETTQKSILFIFYELR